jgi:hypothetical protein
MNLVFCRDLARAQYAVDDCEWLCEDLVQRRESGAGTSGWKRSDYGIEGAGQAARRTASGRDEGFQAGREEPGEDARKMRKQMKPLAAGKKRAILRYLESLEGVEMNQKWLAPEMR